MGDQDEKLMLGVAQFAGIGSAAVSQGTPPFGTDDDAAYTASIWAAMGAQNLTGANQIHVVPYVGTNISPQMSTIDHVYIDIMGFWAFEMSKNGR